MQGGGYLVTVSINKCLKCESLDPSEQALSVLGQGG
jgi:nitrate reductase cytochrome c-type subunit